jgi:hypothetical protein
MCANYGCCGQYGACDERLELLVGHADRIEPGARTAGSESTEEFQRLAESLDRFGFTVPGEALAKTPCPIVRQHLAQLYTLNEIGRIVRRYGRARGDLRSNGDDRGASMDDFIRWLLEPVVDSVGSMILFVAKWFRMRD